MKREMLIGDKIRNIRNLKGLSQENMADMLNLSSVAYGDIERNKSNISLKRLEEIAEILGVSATDILSFGDRVSNFFDQCNGNAVGINNGTANNYESKELQHQLEKANLEIEKLKLEVMYWKEKYESVKKE